MSLRIFPALCGFVLLAAVAPCLAQSQAPPAARPEEFTAAVPSPEALPKVLNEGAAALEDQIQGLESRLADSQRKLAQREADLRNLKVRVAYLKAILAVQNPPLIQMQELLATFDLLDTRTKERTRALAAELEDLRQAVTAQTLAENTLKVQMNSLQKAGEPAATSRETQQALNRYLLAADARDSLSAQLGDILEKTQNVLGQTGETLAGLQPELHSLREAGKTALLEKPPSEKPFKEQLANLWESVAALPGRGWRRLTAIVVPGMFGTFFLSQLPRLLGLSAFLTLLAWGTHRLRRFTAQRLRDLRARRPDLELLPVFVLGQIVMDSLVLLGLILWAGVTFWLFGLLRTTPVKLGLNLLLAWWALRLAVVLVRRFFAGEAADGALPLDKATARFYRRSLEVFAVYLVLGFVALRSASLLNFPEPSRIFANHIFQAGFLALVLWLLRRRPFSRLQPHLPDPAWVRRQGVARLVKGAVFLVLAVTLLADLLGLANLALYLTQAAVWTGLALLLFWFLWLLGGSLIRHLLHPEWGWAPHRYPQRRETLQRIYGLSRLLLSLILGAAVILWSLASWGIPPNLVAWAFQWLTWGPVLGPVRLTPLHIGSAILVFCLGFWLSQLVRGLMARRIFPHTALDPGVQYTMSSTVHYIILLLAALAALTVLGFPLTNLALVLGGLGVGVGFGLQNFVNNFISGLILLFERPIKVGDMLVIDGQWGEVKEIRFRSTIFETYDRYDIIIPNSELISHKVLNWTLYGKRINRLTLKVGVGYNSDVAKVTQLLTDICRANPRVVPDPPPQIYFAVYGESSLDFTIWVYVRTPADRVPATHELNSAILETFNQQGIEIPFPQRQLVIKEWPGAPEEGGGMASPSPPSSPAAARKEGQNPKT